MSGPAPSSGAYGANLARAASEVSDARELASTTLAPKELAMVAAQRRRTPVLLLALLGIVIVAAVVVVVVMK